MGDLEVLLEVQAHDTTTDQLQHRRSTLPERTELEDLLRERATAKAELKRIDAELEAAESRRTALEGEVSEADARISSIEGRMFGGTVTSSKELESMAAEVDSLKSRRSGLEDEALEAMEAAEAVRTEKDRALGADAARVAAIAGAEARLADSEAGVDALIEVEQTARASLVATIAPDLLTAYERIRTKLGGIGAARLEGDRCTGCHLSLPSGEVERLRHEPADAITYCDNCSRILVR
ncbi:MAG TPA: C4-type zinc ribbon domain-containing protein [Acidimicrobiales bacterium]|nr:C4-type zinc ribbon domain-containing protein [Acidimicrobiales bacterium]